MEEEPEEAPVVVVLVLAEERAGVAAVVVVAAAEVVEAELVGEVAAEVHLVEVWEEEGETTMGTLIQEVEPEGLRVHIRWCCLIMAVRGAAAAPA